MVWGVKRNVDDLVCRLEKNDPSFKTLLIMPIRTFGDTEADKFCKALEKNSTLEELLCGGHSITEAGARSFGKALQQNKSLKRLSLGCAKFGDDAAVALFENWANETLLFLDLEFKGLHAASMKSLSTVLSFPNGLQELSLARNSLGDEGVSYLAQGIVKTSALKKLDLRSNGITSKGCTGLGQGLRDAECKREFTLLLDDNSIGSEGLACLASSAPDQDNNVGVDIVEISLRKCNIENVEALTTASCNERSAFRKLRRLHLGQNNITSCKSLCKLIQEDAYLEHLYLDDNSALGVDEVLLLSEAIKADSKRKLRSLDISCTGVDAGSHVTLTVLENLSIPCSLEELKLRGNALGDTGALHFLNSRPATCSIQRLCLSGVGLTSEGCSALVDVLTSKPYNLKSLSLGKNPIGESRAKIDDYARNGGGVLIGIDTNPED